MGELAKRDLELLARAEQDLMKPREVAQLFGVTLKTIENWAKAGKLNALEISRGQLQHRRYRRSEIERLLEGSAKDWAAIRRSESWSPPPKAHS